MKISLIMPTINTYDELDLFLKSLSIQTYKNFELIVIDQNNELNIVDLIEKYQNDFDIKYNKNCQNIFWQFYGYQ